MTDRHFDFQANRDALDRHLTDEEQSTLEGIEATTDPPENPIAELVAEAYAEGKQAAENAASWIVDGNTADEVARSMLRQLRDSDPASDSWMPALDLSGEMAGEPTARSLACDLTGEDDPDPDLIDQLADACEKGWSEHIEAACEKQLIEFLA